MIDLTAPIEKYGISTTQNFAPCRIVADIN